MLKNSIFSASILEGFGRRFGWVFGRFFGAKMYGKCKNPILAKTLKMLIFLRENQYFQEIEDRKNAKNPTKIHEKSYVFWDIDFGWILGGFWEGFGRPKSLIFALFSSFFRCKFLNATWKGKKSKKWTQNHFTHLFGGRCCGPCRLGGKDYRMGGSLPRPQFQALP